MKIKIGNYEVYETGSLVNSEGEIVDFVLDEKTQYVLRLLFVNDPSISGHQVKAEFLDKSGLQFVFTNFNNSLGFGNSKPLNVGIMHGREFLFNYIIYSLEKGKKIDYTFMLGKEVKVGK